MGPLAAIGSIRPTSLPPILHIGSCDKTSYYQSSIAQSTENPRIHSPLRPTLSSPDSHYMWEMIALRERMDETSRAEGALYSQEIDRALLQIREIDARHIELLKKQSDDVKSKHTWQVLANVAQYVSFASSLVLGLGMIGAAPYTATCLIASGSIGVVNRIAIDTGIWSSVADRFFTTSQRSKEIADEIDSALAFISTALLPRSSFLVVSNIFQGSAQLQSTRADKRVLDTKAELNEDDAERKCKQNTIQWKSIDFQNMAQQLEQIDECLKKAIASSEG